jgi:hypothetical protein
VVAEARIWVDVESALREWARDNVPSVDRRVFFGATDKAGLPQIAVFRIFGTDDNALIQFDAWGKDKRQAAAVAAEIATAADELSRYVYDDVLLHGARVETIRWQPDEVSDRARYVMDVTVTATSSL